MRHTVVLAQDIPAEITRPAAVIRPDGIVIRQLGTPSLKWMYEQIGCRLVDVMRGQCGDLPVDLWHDDEGSFRTEEPNSIGYAVARGLVAPGVHPWIKGALVATCERNGETVALTERALDWLIAFGLLIGADVHAETP